MLDGAVPIEPIGFGLQTLIGLRISRADRLAAWIARSGRSDSPKAAERLSAIHDAKYVFGEQLSKASQLNTLSFPGYVDCCPSWYITFTPSPPCKKHSICPFCYSRRLAMAIDRLSTSCCGFVPPGYQLVAIRLRRFLPHGSDLELKKQLNEATLVPGYIRRHNSNRGGEIWSTTLEPASRSCDHRNSELKLRIAGLLLIPADRELEVPPGWDCRMISVTQILEPFHRLGEIVFRFPQRLLFARDARDAVRAARIMRYQTLHTTSLRARSRPRPR